MSAFSASDLHGPIRTVRVLLRWLVDLQQSGQSPRPRQFSTPARFDDQGEDWLKNAWSLVITTEGPPDADGRQSAIARFLMDDAPHEWLSEGKCFTLYGGRPLAEGVVVRILH